MRLRLSPLSPDTPSFIKAMELVAGGGGVFSVVGAAFGLGNIPPAATDPLWWTPLLVSVAIAGFVIFLWGLTMALRHIATWTARGTTSAWQKQPFVFRSPLARKPRAPEPPKAKRQTPWVGPVPPAKPREGDVWIKTPPPAASPKLVAKTEAAVGPGPLPDAAIAATANDSEPEKQSVAIHWLGGQGGDYVAGIPADPTVTTWVTPTRWRRDLMPMRDSEGFPLFALGEASNRVDEANDRRQRVSKHFRTWYDKAMTVADELRNLKGDSLDDMHRPYWKNRVMDAERELVNQVMSRMPSARKLLPEPVDPDALDVDDHWSSVYHRYLTTRLAEYERFAEPTLADVGFPARRADPTSSFGYTSRWGKSVDFSANEDGTVQPLNEDENKLLDNYQLPLA